MRVHFLLPMWLSPYREWTNQFARAADDFLPTVAEVAKTFGRPPKLLASFATGKSSFAARLTPKAFNIVAQGKAKRVLRASPPPWVTVEKEPPEP